jgi:hypothetical protein
VIVTDRGKPCLVILKYEEYQKLSGKQGSILERLYMPGVAEIEFEPPRIGRDEFPRPADFS